MSRRTRVFKCLSGLTVGVLLAACQTVLVMGTPSVNVAERATLAVWSPPEAEASVLRSDLGYGDVPAPRPNADHATAQPAKSASLWWRLRGGMGIEPLRGVAWERMAVHEAWYRQRPEHLRRVFERAHPYLFDIVEEVQAAGLPMEVALLPAVESAFVPKAVSSALADGLWQFIAPTAARFVLQCNLFLDERRSPQAATSAALRYLVMLRTHYNGDMQLAAYNCSEGCIDAHIRRARAKGLAGRFEDLQLNNEMAQYVPRLVALSKVVADAVDSGALGVMVLPDVPNASTARRLALQRDMDKAPVAGLAGVSMAELDALNPQHKGPWASWTVWRERPNITVEAIARAHGGETAAIHRVNMTAPRHLVVAGGTVLVLRLDDVAEAQLQQAFLRTIPAMTAVRIKIRKGQRWRDVTRTVNVKGRPVAEDELWSANPKATLLPGWLQLRVPTLGASKWMVQTVSQALPGLKKRGGSPCVKS